MSPGALQPPHVAESSDDVMTSIEARMQAAAASANVSLRELSPLVPAAQAKALQQVRDVFDRFTESNREILRLSRRNSNARSLALSLGTKRLMTAQAYDALRQLREGMARREETGTR